MLQFENQKNSSSIIKVIGVGGGGGNAVNYMYSLNIKDVDFVVCNTDLQALALSPVANKIQLGPHLTQGLGAGANPEIGKQASEESIEDIARILKDKTKMVFITAGMGGGTGTGGAPVVAKTCKDLGILTVGIVTLPFTYEGKRRMLQAQEGIERMREHVDTILVISNDKLRHQFGSLPFSKAFQKADDVLATAAKCITDVITTTGQINVDFADVCRVMKNGGVAILGNASMSGENRALVAVEAALNSPLLNDSEIKGAKWILLNITSSEGEFEHTMDETEAVQAYVQQKTGEGCDVILGMGHDPNLGDKIAVTVIATGFNYKEIKVESPVKTFEPEKTILILGDKMPSYETTKQVDNNIQNARTPVNLNPFLVETPQPIQWKSQTQENKVNEPVFSDAKITYPLSDTSNTDQPNSNVHQEALNFNDNKVEEPSMKLSIKEELAPYNIPFKIGERVLNAEEMEERRKFEEQKKALEDRADRLKRLSFNIKSAETTDDMESIPAYQRRNKKLDNTVPSKDSYYSGYAVGPNYDNNNGSLSTINTFLEGNKVD